MVFDVFERLDQIAHLLPPERWMLVGGLMVHAHARLAGIPHARPTDDADLVVEVRRQLQRGGPRPQELGYQQHEPLDHRALPPVHPRRRPGGPDAAEDKPVRFAGRNVLGVPGSRSALNRTIPFALPTGLVIRIPDVASALSLKGAAYYLPGSTGNVTSRWRDPARLRRHQRVGSVEVDAPQRQPPHQRARHD